MAESRMGDEEASLDRKQKRLDRDISNGDGTVDDRLQDINDRKVLGTTRGTKTEDQKRAAKKMTMDDHQQDINDLRVLGTRLGGTMKMTRDNHQQDINDQTVLGTRLGGNQEDYQGRPPAGHQRPEGVGNKAGWDQDAEGALGEDRGDPGGGREGRDVQGRGSGAQRNGGGQRNGAR